MAGGEKSVAGRLVWHARAWATAAMQRTARLLDPAIQRLPTERALALTFDDGPNPAITPRLLEILDQYGVRATFFLIGKHVRACGGLVAEMAARGHAVGNHTDTHPDLTWLAPRRIQEELERCQESIAQAATVQARWIRPPYGCRGPQLRAVVRQGGWAGVVAWSLTGRDWELQPAEAVIERLRAAHGGDIVVLHDGDPNVLGADREHTVRALEYWLPRWREAGIEFVSLDTFVDHNSIESPRPLQRPRRD